MEEGNHLSLRIPLGLTNHLGHCEGSKHGIWGFLRHYRGGEPPAEVAQWQKGLELSSGDLISGNKKSP